jgi:hypothetical protein
MTLQCTPEQEVHTLKTAFAAKCGELQDRFDEIERLRTVNADLLAALESARNEIPFALEGSALTDQIDAAIAKAQ